MNNNDMILSYTIDDDGIWLDCLSCGENFSLGFHATVEDAVSVRDKHLKECTGGTNSPSN